MCGQSCRTHIFIINLDCISSLHIYDGDGEYFTSALIILFSSFNLLSFWGVDVTCRYTDFHLNKKNGDIFY